MYLFHFDALQFDCHVQSSSVSRQPDVGYCESCGNYADRAAGLHRGNSGRASTLLVMWYVSVSDCCLRCRSWPFSRNEFIRHILSDLRDCGCAVFWPNRASRTPTESCVTDSDDDLPGILETGILENAQLTMIAWDEFVAKSAATSNK